MNAILSVFLLTLITASHVRADPKLISLFQKAYTQSYQSGRCGDNIVRLLQMAQTHAINLQNASVISIENKGSSVAGMVNAEYARERGSKGSPGEMNWFHHVVLENNGLIYDFDFGNTPSIERVIPYFEVMFLNEKRSPGYGGFYVGRDEKLKNYEITIQSGIEILEARRSREPSPPGIQMKLADFLLRNQKRK